MLHNKRSYGGKVLLNIISLKEFISKSTHFHNQLQYDLHSNYYLFNLIRSNVLKFLTDLDFYLVYVLLTYTCSVTSITLPDICHQSLSYSYAKAFLILINLQSMCRDTPSNSNLGYMDKCLYGYMVQEK